MERRKFAFTSWSADGPNDRHHCFPSIDILRNIIRIKKPKAVFASSARYLDPGHFTMSKKTNKGLDLVFDFDFGDLPEHELPETSGGTWMLSQFMCGGFSTRHYQHSGSHPRTQSFPFPVGRDSMCDSSQTMFSR